MGEECPDVRLHDDVEEWGEASFGEVTCGLAATISAGDSELCKGVMDFVLLWCIVVGEDVGAFEELFATKLIVFFSSPSDSFCEMTSRPLVPVLVLCTSSALRCNLMQETVGIFSCCLAFFRFSPENIASTNSRCLLLGA